MQLDIDMSPPANMTFRFTLTHVTFDLQHYLQACLENEV